MLPIDGLPYNIMALIIENSNNGLIPHTSPNKWMSSTFHKPMDLYQKQSSSIDEKKKQIYHHSTRLEIISTELHTDKWPTFINQSGGPSICPHPKQR